MVLRSTERPDSQYWDAANFQRQSFHGNMKPFGMTFNFTWMSNWIRPPAQRRRGEEKTIFHQMFLLPRHPFQKDGSFSCWEMPRVNVQGTERGRWKDWSSSILWRQGSTHLLVKGETESNSGIGLACSGGWLEVWGCANDIAPDTTGFIHPATKRPCPKLFQGILGDLLWWVTNFIEFLLKCLSIGIPKISDRVVLLCSNYFGDPTGIPIRTLIFLKHLKDPSYCEGPQAVQSKSSQTAWV